jgi:hypothetical protein
LCKRPSDQADKDASATEANQTSNAAAQKNKKKVVMEMTNLGALHGDGGRRSMIDFDGQERVSSRTLMDVLGVP